MTAEWLAAKSRTYWDDAASLARLEDFEADGLDGKAWAIVYRAVSEELRKCSIEIQEGRRE